MIPPFGDIDETFITVFTLVGIELMQPQVLLPLVPTVAEIPTEKALIWTILMLLNVQLVVFPKKNHGLQIRI
jgi:hypothetical protein